MIKLKELIGHEYSSFYMNYKDNMKEKEWSYGRIEKEDFHEDELNLLGSDNGNTWFFDELNMFVEKTKKKNKILKVE